MSNWRAELDELLKQNTTFIKLVNVKIEIPRTPPRAIAEPFTSHPIAKSGDSEREEIMKRVASFKAHQQRATREREEYASSVLVKLKASLSVQS